MHVRTDTATYVIKGNRIFTWFKRNCNSKKSADHKDESYNVAS